VINNRPRKALGWKTPAEVFDDFFSEADKNGVATTA
jgi:IS30 family transposase